MRVSTHPGRLRSPAQGTPRPEPITEAVLNPTIAIGRSEGVTVMDRELTTEHTPTAAEKQKRLHNENPLQSFQLPLLGSNQDSPDSESVLRGSGSGQVARKRSLTEHRCPDSCRSLPARARRNYGETTAVQPTGWFPVQGGELIQREDDVPH
jgi:hypothetical protein